VSSKPTQPSPSAEDFDRAKAAFEVAADALFVVAPDDYTVTAANAQARAELGIDPARPTHLLACIPAAEHSAIAQHLASCVQTRQVVRLSTQLLTDDDGRPPVDLVLSPLPDPNGVSVVCAARWLEHRQSERAFESERNQILEMIARHLPLEQALLAIANMVDRQFPRAITAILLQDQGALSIVGGEGLTEAYYDALRRTDPADHGPVAEALGSERPVIIADATQDQRWRETTAAVRQASIDALWVMPFAEQHRAATGAILLHFAEARMPDEPELDRLHNVLQLCKLALEEHQTSRQLYERANYDPVTRLPNRSLLYDRLGRALEYARRHGEHVAVALCDLDEFKTVNDSLGHAIGDELLQSVAARMSDPLRSEDTVARLGGDEFVLVLPTNDADGTAVVADKVSKALQRPVWLQGHRLSAATSMGIALYPRDGSDTEDLLQSADTAMYAAKRAGRNRYHFYSADLNARVHQRVTIESELRRGLANGELRAHYQPIVAADDGRVLAIEALLRWNHPDHGLCTPRSFLAEAEASDLVCELDRWLLERAATDLRWLTADGYRLKVSVNVSQRDLQQGDFAGRFLQTLRERGLPPRRCEIEITENMLMPDVARARNEIHQLKRRAPELSIAIDDFGTGYASLNYLRDLPIDGLKIDRTFIADTPAQQGDTTRAIGRTIAELGHELGLRVTAEGVERASQLQLTRAIGCDRLQGFYFARPMPRDDLLTYLDCGGPTVARGDHG